MSDLTDIIATHGIRSFNMGMQAERQHVLELLDKHKQETSCDCEGCVSWTNAFAYLTKEIKGEIND